MNGIPKLTIGGLVLANPVILAPMAGVTDLPFRLLCKESGCGLVVSEMISDNALLFDNDRTLEMLRMEPAERPVAMQIFGSNPELMAQAAQKVEAAGADIIDINMGCPAPKIVKNGEGSALMRKPELAQRILRAVVAAVQVPVTVKIRKGWSEQEVNAVELALLAEEAGVAAVAVHGRTREQFYEGKADWQIIREVKEALSIPVIGNGDVWSPADAARMLEQTGCDGIMVGRGCQGNPWLFRDILAYLQTGVVPPAPSLEERRRFILRHLDMLMSLKGEYVAVREMRRHAAWYTKGVRGAARWRQMLNQALCRDDFERLLEEMLAAELSAANGG